MCIQDKTDEREREGTEYMNILFFLTPKSKVAYLYDTESLRQALEKMENHRYSAIPLISKKTGEYIGTITEGDLLWDIKNRYDLSLKDAEDIPVITVLRNRDNLPVSAEADMEDLLNKVMNQNFVPVIDGMNRFIGIITRRDVILYLMNKNKED